MASLNLFKDWVFLIEPNSYDIKIKIKKYMSPFIW